MQTLLSSNIGRDYRPEWGHRTEDNLEMLDVSTISTFFDAVSIEEISFFATEVGKLMRLEDALVFSPELSEIEIRDIAEGIKEIESGKAKKFEKIEDALAWLDSSE